MSDAPRSSRHWLERVRSLRDHATRQREGLCYVEGIRQVLSAVEGGYAIDALLVDPARLRSDVALGAVERLRQGGTTYVELTKTQFERISSRDNPVGIAAIVRWSPEPLSTLTPTSDGLYLVCDDVRDPGNLGTMIRTLDAAGGQAVIVHGGTDPGHANALRASLGTTFQVPVYSAATLDDLFAWSKQHGVTVLGTSAKAKSELWETALRLPLAVLVGNEGAGLAPSTVERCDLTTRIPMLGTATSLNVSVAAGVMLYEARRRASS
jgi:TrmH family RNA methyltransferase